MFGENIFIGIQNEIIEDLQRESDAAPITVVPLSAEGMMRGSDGLIVATQSAVTRAE
jgi:hypothetical protein